MLDWDHKTLIKYEGQLTYDTYDNPYRARYIHMFNLWSLLAYVIPAVQDYGIALKLNNNVDFMPRYLQLLLVLLMCDTLGARMYARNMTFFYALCVHWKANGHIIHDLMSQLLTLFSEESGELALGQLVFKMSKGGDPRSLDQVNSHWQNVTHKGQLSANRLPPHVHTEGKRRNLSDSDDEAIERLVAHFQNVIVRIENGEWTHLPYLMLDEGTKDEARGHGTTKTIQ